MDIIIPAPLKENNDELEMSSVQEIEKYLRKFDSDVTIFERNIGHGADWTVLLISLGTFGSIFLLGEKIQKNLNAWIAIAKRVIQLFTWLKEKYGLARIDESGAIAVAINDLASESTPLVSLRLETCQTVCFTPVLWNPAKRLDGKPDALYVFSINVNGNSVYVYGIKSKGTIEFKHSYSTEWLEF